VPGGWNFDGYNKSFPDTDTTTVNLELLARTKYFQKSKQYTRQFYHGVKWLLNMQNTNGSFATWERGNSPTAISIAKILFPEMPEFHDLGNHDVTSRIIRFLVYLKNDPELSFLVKQNSIAKACDYLKNAHLENAPHLWGGKWVIGGLYGTSEVINSLIEAKCISLSQAIPSIDWIIKNQNGDGGFGERQESFLNGRPFIAGKSSTIITNYVLQVLINFEIQFQHEYGKASPALPSIDKAMSFLINHLNQESALSERVFSGVFIPGLWYANYNLVPLYTTVRSLGLYQQLEKVR
jgi:squalene cyclase